MISSREALDKIYSFAFPSSSLPSSSIETFKYRRSYYERLYNIIKKDLDVLEILKKKKVVIDWNSNDVFTFDEHLTKEEENKIKEWMKNDN